MSHFSDRTTRIGIFYDGSFFFHVSNYYQYHHERRQRIKVGGLHAFVREQVAKDESTDVRYCHIVDAHYFRGRLKANDADDRDLLYRERVFDDVLVREGVTAHYLPLSRDGEKGIDVWLALEAYELAIHKKFDVVVLVVCDGDFLPLVRKLNALGTRVMVMAWDFSYTDVNGHERETRTSQALLEEATYPIMMPPIIDDRSRRNDTIVNGLFVPPREFSAAPAMDRSRDYTPRDNGSRDVSPRDQGPREFGSGLTRDVAVGEPVDGVEQVGMISNLRNGYGFITPSHGGENIFFFHLDVIDTDFLDLRIGDKVEYIASGNERGPCAKDVRVIRPNVSSMAGMPMDD